MNPGYLSLLSISVSLILIASGWKDVLLRGISHRSVLLFFIGWITLSFVKFAWNGIVVYGVAAFLALYALGALRRVGGAFARLHLLASSVLFGVFHYVLMELDGFVPWFDFADPKLETALITAAVAMLIAREPRMQFFVVSCGLLAGEILFVCTHFREGLTARLGGPVFQDLWWLTFALARSLTIALEYGWGRLAEAVRIWNERSREWRK